LKKILLNGPLDTEQTYPHTNNRCTQYMHTMYVTHAVQI
jgi:hypothetical protein